MDHASAPLSAVGDAIEDYNFQFREGCRPCVGHKACALVGAKFRDSTADRALAALLIVCRNVCMYKLKRPDRTNNIVASSKNCQTTRVTSYL